MEHIGIWEKAALTMPQEIYRGMPGRLTSGLYLLGEEEEEH